MSYRLQDIVWSSARLSRAADKLVLLALAYRADDYGSSWPSVAGLAALTSLDQKTVRKSLASLVSLGLISREDRPGSPCLWLIREECVLATPAEICTHTKNGTPTKFGTTAKSGTPTKNGTPPLPKTAGVPLPKTVDEQVIQQAKEQVMREEKKPRASSRFVPTEVGKEIDRGTYSDWMKVRKVPMTATAWTRFVSGVSQTTLTLQQAVELCAEKGWRGFDPSWEAVRRAEARCKPKDPTADMSFKEFDEYLEKKKREEEAREREERRRKDEEEERRVQAWFEDKQRKEREQLLQYLKESEAHGDGNGRSGNSADVRSA